MKSILKKFTGIAFTTVLAMMVAGCNHTVNTHKHTYDTEWSSDETYHWHSATCEHTDEIADKAEHIWDKGKVITESTYFTKGVKSYKCSACGYVNTEEIPELYSSPIDFDTKKAATADSEYILFGVFPKTIKATDVTFDPEPESVTMGANTYYKAKDGKYYAKVTANPYLQSSKYYSDGTPVTDGEEYYFLVEPIKWKVLTKDYNGTGKALLLAEDILTANVPYYKYSTPNRTRTVGTDSGIYPNNYKYSQIRAYLNGLDFYYDEGIQSTVKITKYTEKGFLQTAFTAKAKEKIETTTVDNSAASTTDAGGNIDQAISYECDDTQDKIFLLSEKEVTTGSYGFTAYNSYGEGNTRIKKPTDYAIANFALLSSIDGNSGRWWLRSPVWDRTRTIYACYVYRDGNTYNIFNNVECSYIGVVPALTISF